MDNRKVLNSILNGLMRVETKGEGTLIMADCMRGLSQVIQSMSDEGSEEKKQSQKKNDK